MDVYNLLRENRHPEVCSLVALPYADKPCVVLKTHAPFKAGGNLHRFPDIGLHTAGFVYICRNPLDVLLSYINFTRIEYKFRVDDAEYRKNLFINLLGFDREFGLEDWRRMTLESIPQENLDRALSVFSSNSLCIPTLAPMAGSWQENVQSWMDAKNSGTDGEFIRYEELLRDASQFERLCKYFSFSAEDLKLAMNSIEATNSRKRQTSNEGGPSDDAIFLNRMRANYYGEHFSPSAISKFLLKHESLLRSVGYADMLTSV